MSEQPPAQPPNKLPAGNQPTQPMAPAASAAPGVPPAGPPAVPPAGPATPASGDAPKQGFWQRTTSTTGGRWGLGIAAAALAFLMILGVGITGIVLLRHGDRVNPFGHRQDAFSRGQGGPGDGRGLDNGRGGNGQGPGDNRDDQQRRVQPGMPGNPGMPGGRGQGMGGLGNLLGGTALHGEVTATVNGSAQALLFQRGEVTAVSATSITLKSSDGFVGTYGRAAATITRAAPVKGGQAFVLARSSDKVAITTMAIPTNTGVAPGS